MAKTGNKYWQWLLAGILFAILWPSASTATKVGLTAAQPLVIALVRFALASSIMLFIAHGIKKQRLPKKDEWKQIALYGFLNITVYLGCYVIAMQNITAGIGALAVAINPVFISFLSVFFLKEKLTIPIIIALSICTIGVVCASWPLFGSATVTVSGLLILLFSMLSYSAGAIYFSSKSWNGLSLLTINGWQTLLGGIFLLPVMILFYKSNQNHFTIKFWLSASWLAIPVSIIAVQLWMWLLSINPVRAGLWLFLCPLFGFIIAAWWMGDNIDIFTVIGVLLVITGLLLSKINARKNQVVFD
ncbi:MAG: DMT family transporter [Ferruginibacter sp.]|nr:DMT family transporter [Bacteroidota bacterium]MBX2918648.1 DMT family transporter [Ferruginibacter sp.]